MNIFPLTLTSWIITTLLVASSIVAYRAGKLTLLASVAGGLVGLLIYLGAGLPGLVMLALFFVLGTAVTSFKKGYKQKMGLAETNDDKRKVSQVLANGGVASIIALFSIVTGNNGTVILVMIAASLASATGDTFSSELGNIYGCNFYNIITLQKDKRGLNGVISLEGTLFGIFGSVVIALTYAIGLGMSFTFVVIALSGFIGNLCDSILGALFERKGYLNNDAVNFLNTAIAALLALLLMNIYF